MNINHWKNGLAFAYEALLFPINFNWIYQGLGLYCTDFMGDFRLHVWAYPGPGMSRVHSHPWDLASLVLAGTIYDDLYKEVPDSQGGLRRMRRWINCAEGTWDRNADEEVKLNFVDRREVDAGSMYSMWGEQIHCTKTDPGTVTLIRKRSRDDRSHAAVYYDPRASFGHAVNEPVSPYTVQRVLRKHTGNFTMPHAETLRRLENEL